jgi:hypothetical protein
MRQAAERVRSATFSKENDGEWNLICPYDPAISESIFKEAIHHGIFEKLKIKWLQ